MSAFKRDIINKGVGKMFQPADPVKAARGVLFSVVGTVLLSLAAWRLGSPLAAALAAWVAWRLFVLAMLALLGSDVVAEREKRLSSLPSGWRDYLITGEKPREYTTYPGARCPHEKVRRCGDCNAAHRAEHGEEAVS